MWQKKIKKAIFTLDVDNFDKEITAITYPLIERYAQKIGAEFVVISERKFPDWPPVYEKIQIYELGQQMENDWNIYIDADALIHPDLYDLTVIIPKDTVLHHGNDFAPIRWRYDRFFLRDGRHLGSGNWFTIASDWCIELWKPLDDLTLDEAKENIFPIQDEINAGVFDPSHLIDDYTLSRNIAKYGLKFAPLRKFMEQFGLPGGGNYFYHNYLAPREGKIVEFKNVLRRWGVQL
jgi:hypothetical protein